MLFGSLHQRRLDVRRASAPRLSTNHIAISFIPLTRAHLMAMARAGHDWRSRTSTTSKTCTSYSPRMPSLPRGYVACRLHAPCRQAITPSPSLHQHPTTALPPAQQRHPPLYRIRPQHLSFSSSPLLQHLAILSTAPAITLMLPPPPHWKREGCLCCEPQLLGRLIQGG